MRSPPMCTSCSGLRACTQNSDGALATCSSTNSGSKLHEVALDLLTGRAEELERARLVELHADLRHQPLPAALDELDGLGRERLVARHAVREHLTIIQLQLHLR